MYLDMFLSELVASRCSVFAAMGPLPSPPAPLPTAPVSCRSQAPAPSSFSGVGHSLKEFSAKSGSPQSFVDDDLNLAMALSMLGPGPAALKIAIVAPQGERQVCMVQERNIFHMLFSYFIHKLCGPPPFDLRVSSSLSHVHIFWCANLSIAVD